MAKIIKIHHVAIALGNMDDGIKVWKDQLGLTLEHIEAVESQKADVAFLPVSESEIELVVPTDQSTGVAKFINEKGSGIHHICFEVDDIEGMLVDIKNKGLRLINETPVILPDRKIAFIHPKSTNGVLIELYQVIK